MRYEQDAKNIPPQLAGELLRAILSGGPYPRSLLANTIMRFRADGDISGLRVALCKGVLARERRRDIRTSEEEIPVSLDKQSTQPGYLAFFDFNGDGRIDNLDFFAFRNHFGTNIP